MGLVTENIALNCNALGLAASDYFQEQSRTVMCNEEIDMISPKVVTIWRQAEEAAEENVPFALHHSDTLSSYGDSL